MARLPRQLGPTGTTALRGAAHIGPILAPGLRFVSYTSSNVWVMSGAVWALGKQELRGELLAVWSQEQQCAARRLELIREIDARGIAKEDGCTSLTAWLNGVLRVIPAVARRMQATAAMLDDPACAATAAALAAGVVHEGQAAVIGRCVTDLAESGAASPAAVQDILLALAGAADPHVLAGAADHALRQADPAAADERERKRLEDAEKRAARDRYFTLSPLGDGRTRLSGILSAEAAAVVNAAMQPLCRPADPDDHRTAGQRRADALQDVCGLGLATDQLPQHRGEKTTMGVTAPFDPLTGLLGEGMLDTGQKVTAETVRRLACDAGIFPAILNGQGLPLDLGRVRRLFQGAVRKALELRDGGCAFPGCDRPPKWAEAHHPVHWCEGGTTCLANGVLLCGHHHRLIHHSEWQVYIAADGMPEFIPPAHVDSSRTPRRNHYHRRP